MSDKSAISWTDATWNPVTGCTKVSPGCAHCYIERTPPFRMNGRKFVRGTIPVVLHPKRLAVPLHWKKPRRIFVNALSDLFHEDVPDTFIDQVFGVMSATPRHTYQVLTKRPERMLRYLTERGDEQTETHALYDEISGARFRIEKYAAEYEAADLGEPIEWRAAGDPLHWPRHNVHLGVSVENQHWADVRIPLLLQTPAAVRFISAEPLLGQVWLNDEWICQDVADETLNWVIVGGESGPGRREMDPAWLESVVQQCRAAGVPVFVKQDSGPTPGKQGRIPDELWVKEFPR